jgi:hypothetical protein
MSKTATLAAALQKRAIFVDRGRWRNALEKEALRCLKMSSVAKRSQRDKEIIHAFLIRTSKYFFNLPSEVLHRYLDFLCVVCCVSAATAATANAHPLLWRQVGTRQVRPALRICDLAVIAG